MNASKDPNATLAFDVVSAPANESNAEQDSTTELAVVDKTQEENKPTIDKEKLKIGGIGAAAGAVVGAAGTAAAMTYGADALAKIEEAETSAVHAVQDFLGIHHEPDAPQQGPAPDPNTPATPAQPEAHTNTPAHEQPDPAPAPQPTANHDEPQQPAVQPVAVQVEQPQQALIDLDHDGQPDAVIVDDNGNQELVIDMNHDGQIDGIAIDADHDGQFDHVLLDTDHDGFADQETVDVNNDGVVDGIVVDTDGDHGLDTIYADTNQDGQITLDDDHQLTGDNQVIAFADQGGDGVGANHDEDIAHNAPPAADDYNPDGDVHEWVA